MKTLKNRTLTEEQRQEVYELAFDWDIEKTTFKFLRSRLLYMYSELNKNNGKPAYSAKDAKYEAISNNQIKYNRTGKF